MKTILSLLMKHFQSRPNRRNLRVLFQFLVIIVVMIGLYSVGFHYLMEREGQHYSWITGIYWTLTVMSTLGFGDITFHTDIGRIFSIIVLLSGITTLLVFMPFTFIEFFYEPWMKAQSDKRVPKTMDLSGHVVLVGYGSITRELVDKLVHYQYRYVLLKSKLEEALRLHDQGLNVVAGSLDDPETYRRINLGDAAMVVTTNSDFINTSVVSAVREVSSSIPIISTSRERETTDILKFAGCNHVLELSEKVGQALARRALGDEVIAHVIGRMDKVLIAEANAIDTPFVGKSLADSSIRDMTGVTVVGLWEHGRFELAGPDTIIDKKAILVLTASNDQLTRFNEICKKPQVSKVPVIIIGGGRVGRSVAEGLAIRGIEYRIIEQVAERIRDKETYIAGNALKKEVLVKAGINEAQAVIITTHDDDVNVYLSIFCRRLRDNIRIISRVKRERSISTLHRSGSDFVISDAAMGANTILNLLKRSDVLMVSEGVDVFKVKVPQILAGKSIAESCIRSETGCNVVAIDHDGNTIINPEPTMIMEKGIEIVLIGTEESENLFFEKYGVEETGV